MTASARIPARGRPSGTDLAALVGSAAAGDQRSWDALVQEFGGLIWAITRAHRLDHGDAADVAQTTWLTLLEHLDQLHDPTRVGAWLATTARRECLRILRTAKKQFLLGDCGSEVGSPDSPPDEELLIGERDRALWRTFNRLRANDQALLRLLIADPRPAYEEISAALDMPVGSIGPTRARALERLRQQLDSEQTLALMRPGEEPW